MARIRIPRNKSKRLFKAGAQRRHPKNDRTPRPMRGGIRL